MSFSIPAPHLIFRPLRIAIVFLQHSYWFLKRVFFCEPLFKAACTSYGTNVHTGAHLHWVQGAGDLIVGNNVTIDGKCSFFFASKYTGRPSLTIGHNTGIGHNCSFVVGKSIRIGQHCRIAAFVQMFDSPGHPLDPDARKAGQPANAEDVRPIIIGDNVWIGTNAIVFPGVTVGDNSVVALGSVVMQNVPPNVVVSGNPARQIAKLTTRAGNQPSAPSSSANMVS